MESWHSYPSIYAVGHRAVQDLMNGQVNVEEKVDGSQFSFGKTESGELMFRSKGAILLADAPEKMFVRAVESIKERAALLTPGWTYRGEYLRSPKHNSLGYQRVPDGNVIVFDVNKGHEEYLPYEEKKAEAERIGLECVDLIFTGMVSSANHFAEFLERDSALGGVRIEGVVVKPRDYNLFGLDKKVLMAKFVSEHFKEVHAKEWKKTNPTHGDVLITIGQQYATEARWRKAIEHLRDAGKLEGSPRDIGALVKEVPADVRKECEEEIKDQLFKWAWPSIQRMAIRGLPEWYKGTLLAGQFSADKEVA